VWDFPLTVVKKEMLFQIKNLSIDRFLLNEFITFCIPIIEFGG